MKGGLAQIDSDRLNLHGDDPPSGFFANTIMTLVGLPAADHLINANGIEMGMSGVHREIVVPERIVATEKFDQSWYPGEAVGTIVLVEESGRTTLTQTVLYESREAREVVLQSPMESGVAASYDRLEELVGSIAAGRNSPGVKTA